MPKKTGGSDVECAARMLSEIYLALDRAVCERGGQAGDVYRLVTEEDGALIDNIAKLIVEAGMSARNADECIDETPEDFPYERPGSESVELKTIPFQFIDLENDTPREMDCRFDQAVPSESIFFKNDGPDS